LLQQAAEVLVRPPRTPEEATRAANTVRSIFARLEARIERRAPPPHPFMKAR
jgi:hypothetical protein